MLAAIISAVTGLVRCYQRVASVPSSELLDRLYIKPMLTQSEGELVEPLQLGHKGADCIPGLLLKSEVAWVLDGLQARNTSRGTDVTFQK